MLIFKEKKIVATAALPYANGELHIGHIRSTYLPVDIQSRFFKANGYQAYSICGTDEHGTPILVRSIEEKKDPREIVDYYHKKIKESLEKTGIHFDIFSRTSKEEHHEMTKKLYLRIKKAGYTYRKNVKVLYCEHDKISLPDRLVKGTCPYCGSPNQYGDHCEVCGRTYSPFELKDPKCAICGRTPVVKEKKHVFFALSEFEDKLEKWIKNDVKLTKGVKEHVLSWIKEGLHDWDISRDINWGVKIPDSPDQVFYVWFDAPIGYITFSKELFDSMGLNWEDVWIEEKGYIIHYIGKDIIYHHALFWPAMLMAAEFSLPNEIRVRGFATLEGRKMSKSKRWYISLEDFISIWTSDYLRFYWAYSTSESLDDGDFSLREFEEKINKILIGEIGNYVHRILTLVNRGKILESLVEKEIVDNFKEYLKNYEKNMLENQLDQALKVVIEFAGYGNRLLSAKEPWKNLNAVENRTLLSTLAISVVEIINMLEAYTPESIRAIKENLKIEESGVIEPEYLSGEVKLKQLLETITSIKKPKPLFKKVTEEEIKKAKSLLGIS